MTTLGMCILRLPDTAPDTELMLKLETMRTTVQPFRRRAKIKAPIVCIWDLLLFL